MNKIILIFLTLFTIKVSPSSPQRDCDTYYKVTMANHCSIAFLMSGIEKIDFSCDSTGQCYTGRKASGASIKASMSNAKEYNTTYTVGDKYTSVELATPKAFYDVFVRIHKESNLG